MDQIVFLGTAGARFAVFKQIRASGGIWIILDNTQILVDPGPGSLIRCLKSKANLDPTKLDGIILSHRHLDHSGDINIMIEAMTQGGFKPRGVVFAPKDALEEDPVIFRYVQKYVNSVEVLKAHAEYEVGNVKFTTPIRHLHPCETYGINFLGSSHTISYIVDTKYFDGLESYYNGDILIINVVLLDSKDEVDHLSLADAERIIAHNKPRLTILTHFGMNMIRAKPWELANKLKEKLGVDVRAASDGMRIEL